MRLLIVEDDRDLNRQVAAALVFSIMPTLVLATFTQRYLVEGLSLGAIKG